LHLSIGTDVRIGPQLKGRNGIIRVVEGEGDLGRHYFSVGHYPDDAAATDCVQLWEVREEEMREGGREEGEEGEEPIFQEISSREERGEEGVRERMKRGGRGG
jgi:hypothetical protein